MVAVVACDLLGERGNALFVLTAVPHASGEEKRRVARRLQEFVEEFLVEEAGGGGVV